MGKSISGALIYASTNPQYDNRLFIESPVQYMKIATNVVYKNCFFVLVLTFRTIYVSNMFSTCSHHVLNWEILCTKLVNP